MASNSSLNLAGDQIFGNLAGSGTVALDTFTLRTGQAGNSSFAGNISGTGGLVKQGPSNFTLTGNLGYTGGTDVDAGTLVSEEYLMALERKHFSSLLAHPKSQERMMGLLQSGKPLRN